MNCVPWSVTILDGFQYFGKCSFFNLFMTAFVLARLSGYNTTYLEKASMVDKIYLNPPFEAGIEIGYHRNLLIEFHLAFQANNFSFRRNKSDL